MSKKGIKRSSNAEIPKGKKSRVSVEQFENREEILATVLPPAIYNNSISNSRVVVRTVGDLEVYVNFINELNMKWNESLGYKKSIAELLNVSSNRISEWQRIYSALKQYSNFQSIIDVRKDENASLSSLIKALKKEGWEACPGGRYSESSKTHRKVRKSLAAVYDIGTSTREKVLSSCDSFLRIRPRASISDERDMQSLLEILEDESTDTQSHQSSALSSPGKASHTSVAEDSDEFEAEELEFELDFVFLQDTEDHPYYSTTL